MRYARIIFEPMDLNKPLINAEFPESAVSRSVIIIALDMRLPDSIAYRVHRANREPRRFPTREFRLEEFNDLPTIVQSSPMRAASPQKRLADADEHRTVITLAGIAARSR
jgi:hypothetical protein